MDEFIDWCRHCGMQFEGVEIKKADENAGYGVFAKRYFRPEEKMIVIPDEYILTGGKVADMEGYSDIADRANPKLTPFEMLTVFFAKEDPSNSEWGAYLNVLPKTFDTPDYLGLRFSPDDVPLSSREHLTNHQTELRTNMTKLEAVLPDVSRQKLMWAWHVVNTRCVYNENRHHPKLDNSDGDTLIVAPLIDMLNHNSISQCIFLADKFKHNYVVKANTTVCEGDEALVTYGPHSNARLWYCYGFRLATNIHNKVVIPHELLFELAKHIGLNVTEENQNAIYEGNFPNTIYASDDSLSWQFLTNLKILLMSREGATEFRSHALTNLDYDKEPEIPLRIRIHETAIRILETLKERITRDKENSLREVHWIWDEDSALLDNVIRTTRDELAELEQQAVIEGQQVDD